MHRSSKRRLTNLSMKGETDLGRYILKRFALMMVTLFIIITVTFFFIHQLPGTPLQNEEKLPDAVREQILKEYGLDQPLHIQYFRFLGGLLRGDLGKSLVYEGRDIDEMLLERFQTSAWIGLQAILIGVTVGGILGILSGFYQGTWIDNLSTSFSVLGVSIPSFVFAGLLSYGVGVQLGWLPPALWGSYEHTILPSLSLSVLVIAQIARYVRMEMVDVLNQDYIKTAKAKGLKSSTILIKHALRNAILPAVTVLGPLTVNIITGSLVVEKIFSIPGMGAMFVDSILQNDYTAILGTTIFYGGLIILVILLIDLLYGLIDPRIRLTGKRE